MATLDQGIIARQQRQPDRPRVIAGTILSGDLVIKQIISRVRNDGSKKVIGMDVSCLVGGSLRILHVEPTDIISFEKFKQAAIRRGVYVTSESLTSMPAKNRQRSWDMVIAAACRLAPPSRGNVSADCGVGQ